MANAAWLYVALLYALSVAAARRAGATMPWRVGLLFYLTVLAFLWLPLTQPYVNTHPDVLKNLPPWTFLTHDHRAINPEMNDVPLQMVPWAHLVRESWRHGTVPLWNEAIASGYPLLANGQSAALSPFRLLALPLSLGHAMSAEAALKLLVALTYAFLFARRRYSELASVLAAISFAFCGFMAVYLHFPHTSTGCFLPALLYHAELLVERRSWSRFAGASVVWVLMLFGGHPETAAHAFFIALLFVAWLLFVEKENEEPAVPRGERIRALLGLGGALAVAGLLAAPLLLPVVEAIPLSQRYASLHQKAHPQVLAYSDFASAVVMLAPHFFGDVPGERPWNTAETESVGGAAGTFRFAAWIAVAIAVITARRWRSREAFYALMTLFLVAAVFSWPGIREIVHAIFPLAANARLRLPLNLFLALLSAAAIDQLRDTRIPLLAGICAMAALLLSLLTFMRFPLPSMRATAVLGVLPGAAVLLVATMAVMTRRRLAFAALVATVTAEIFLFARPWNPPEPEKLLLPRTPILDKLQELRTSEPYRVVGLGAMFFPNLPALYGFEDIRAHDPMSDNRYLEFLAATSHFDPSHYHALWLDDQGPVLDFLGVRYFVGNPAASLASQERFTLRYDAADGRIWENSRALPRFFAVRNVTLVPRQRLLERLRTMTDFDQTAVLERLNVGNDAMRDLLAPRPPAAPVATARVQRRDLADYEIDVTAPRYSLIVSSVPWWPGWSIESDGRRLEATRVNYAFLGFVVPPGTHHVRVHYRPPSFYAGAAVSLLTLAVLLGFGVRSAVQRRARPVAIAD